MKEMKQNSKASIPIVYLASLLTFAFLSGSASTVLLFVVFAFVYIQLPGMLVLSDLRGENRDDAEIMLHSFFLGMGLLILEFYIFSTIGIRLLFVLFSPALSAGLLVKLFIKGKRRIHLEGDPANGLQLLAAFVICLILACINQQYAFGNLHDYAAVYLYQDMSWHVGNVALLSQGSPFSDFRFAGLKFNYHYFNDLIFAMCKYCFKVSAWELMVKCTPVLTAYTFSLGMHALFKRYSRRPLLGVIMFMLCGAADTFYILNTDKHSFLLNYHIFSNINGVAVSLAALISVYLFYTEMYDEDKLRKTDLIILPVLVFVMTGLKGPFAVVIIAAMLFTGAVRLIEDRNLSRFILVSIAEGCSFIATYIVIIKGVENLFRESNNNRATELSVWGSFSRSKYGETFNNLLEQGDKAHFLAYCLVVVVVGGIMAAGLYYLLFMLDTVSVLAGMIRNRKIPSADRLVSVAAGWTGVAGFLLVSHIGFSQAYFLFVGILFIVLESFRILERAKAASTRRILVAVMIVYSIVNCGVFVQETVDTLEDDSEHFAFYETISDNSEKPSVMTREELEGLEWIRDNTDSDSIIATDRIDLWSKEYPSAEDDCRCFYYSAFAERQMLIEGYSYSDIPVEDVRKRLELNRKIYSADSEEALKAVEESGADYIIVSKRFGEYEENGNDPVFANDDIAVYDVR